MFDLGWSKLIIIAIVAIVVVGPKDLPPLLRAIGKFLSQMRRQAEEFRAQFNEAMKDTGLDEIRRDVDGIRSTAQSAAYDITRSMEDSTRPLHDAVDDINRSATASSGTSGLNGHAGGAADAAVTSTAAEPASSGATALSPAAAAASAAASSADMAGAEPAAAKGS